MTQEGEPYQYHPSEPLQPIPLPAELAAFLNVADPSQRADFAVLADQEHFLLFFYNEVLRHRLSKLVPNSRDEAVRTILAEADRLRAQIPPGTFDFDLAKHAILRTTKL